MATKTEIQAELPFELARRLLITCEDVLVVSAPLPSTTYWRAWQWARELLDSLFLNFHGASRMSGSVGKAIFFSLAIPAFIFWVLKPIGLISPQEAPPYTYAGWMLLGMAIAFSKPSRYALTGYSRKDVDRVIARMSDIRLCSKETCSAIRACIQRAEEETKSRLMPIKWIAGTAFAIAIYLTQKGIDLRSGEIVGYAFYPLIIAAFIAGCIAIHARGTSAVYGLAHATLHYSEMEQDLQKVGCVKRTRWLARRSSAR